MDQELLVLRILKIIVAVLGGILVYYSAIGYRKRRERLMMLMALGFGLITIASLSAGIFFEFAGFSLIQVSIVEALLIAIGFSIIVYSIRSD